MSPLPQQGNNVVMEKKQVLLDTILTEVKHVRSVSLLSHGMTVLSPRTECETMQLAGEDGLMSVTGH